MSLFFKNSFKYQFNVNVGSKKNELKLHSVIQFLNVLVFLTQHGNPKLLFFLDLWNNVDKACAWGIFLYRLSFNIYSLFK